MKNDRYSLRLTKLSLLLIASLLIISCGSDSGDPKKLSSEQTGLVRKYQTMKLAGMAGDVTAFLSMRDSVTNVEIGNYQKNWGWTIDSTKVSNWATNWPDVAGLPIFQDTTDGEWRRLVFAHEPTINEKGEEVILYSVILWRKNNDEWKVSNATRMMGRLYNPDGTKAVLNEFSFHRLFRIPPVFDDLHKMPPEEGADSLKVREKPQARPID
ncbi:MAG: hypothetical protein V3V99_04665 [candidate division Zixibacteria bacterium]